MTERPDHHPPKDQLLAFAEGRLPKEAGDRIAEHVELCDSCANHIDSVTVTAESVLFSQEQPTIDRKEPPSFTTAVTEVPELLEIIGSGGMGVVWRARQSAIGRDVAVKLLHIPMPQKNAESHRAAERFQREIRALGSVQHPHLARIYSSGISEEGRLFYSMELIDGANLSMVFRELVRQSALESQSESDSKLKSSEHSTSSQYSWNAAVAEACRRDSGGNPESDAKTIAEFDADVVKSVVTVIRQVALAVQALHDAGIVHRDIKPGNIMVNVSGDHATLMDLGLADLTDNQQTRLTRTGQIAGSLPYVSPEQFRGEPPSKSGDIYNLGAVLWELLTLRKLFQATEECSEAELLHRILHQEPESVCRYRSDVSRDLDAVVLKCLEKQPANRYSDVGDLIADLDCYLAGDPVSAAHRGKVFRIRRHLKRHRTPVLTALLLLAGQVLLFVVLAGSSASRNAIQQSLVDDTVFINSGAPFASPDTALPAAVINDGSLVAWWSAEGTTSAVPDRSPNGNNGALIGDTSRAAGIFGKAFSFDGDGDYISFGRSSKWNFLHDGSPFSVTGFVAPSASNLDGGILTTIDETSTAAQRHGFSLRLDGSRHLEFHIQGLSGKFPVGAVSKTVLPADIFTAFAVTFDGHRSNLYLNGQLEGFGEASAPFDTSTAPDALCMGSIGTTSGPNGRAFAPFEGQIDEVQIYDRVLGVPEIAVLSGNSRSPHGRLINVVNSISIAPGGTAAGTSVTATHNGQGIGAAYPTFPATHTEDDADAFLTAAVLPASLHYDFGRKQAVNQIRLWNYHGDVYGPEGNGKGVRNIRVYYSNDAAAFHEVWHDSWELLTSFTAERAPADGSLSSYGEEHRFDQQTCRFIRLQLDTNFGGDSVGIAEVQFLHTTTEH